MIKHSAIIESPTTNPYFNLALEELLLENLKEHQCILYLWQNENTIVIGKNQNAWKECDVERFIEENGKIVRRLSGGGAVFHDLGNLNFTFLINQEDYDVYRQLTVIQQALAKLQIEAIISGRNDMTVNGRKISGNAFYKKGNHCYHHGTLLVCADQEKMVRYLKPSMMKLASKGVVSVRSRTANLTEFNASVSIDSLKEVLCEAFEKEYGCAIRVEVDVSMSERIEKLMNRYDSDQWNLNVEIIDGIKIERRFGWGELQLHYEVENGIIQKIQIFTDAMESDWFEILPKRLKGCQLNDVYKIIRHCAKEYQWNEEIERDLLSCFAMEENHGTL